MESDAKKRLRLVDLIIPVAAVAYALYYIASVRTFPFQAQVTGVLLAAILTILCAIYFVRYAIEARRGGTRVGWEELLGEGTTATKRLIFAGLTVLSIVVVPWGGFTLTTFAFLTAAFVVMGVHPLWRAVLAAAIAAIAGWLFFIVLLGTRFPRGPFEHLVDRVF